MKSAAACSPNLAHYLLSFLVILLGINLGDASRTMAQYNPCRFDAELSSQPSRRVMAKLMRMPFVLATPLAEFLPLLWTQTFLPLSAGLPSTLLAPAIV